MRRRADLNRMAVLPVRHQPGGRGGGQSVDHRGLHGRARQRDGTRRSPAMPPTSRSQIQGQLGGYYNSSAEGCVRGGRRGLLSYTRTIARGARPERQHRTVAAVVPRLPAQPVQPAPHESDHAQRAVSHHVGRLLQPERRRHDAAAPLWQGTAWDRTMTRPATIRAPALIIGRPTLLTRLVKWSSRLPLTVRPIFVRRPARVVPHNRFGQRRTVQR